MMIEGALITKLAGDARVSQIVAGRIHPASDPQNVGRPKLTYHRIGTVRPYHNDGPVGTAVAHFQFDCWADDLLVAKALAQAVRWCVDGFSGYVGTQYIDAIHVTDERDGLGIPHQPGREKPLQRVTLDVHVQHPDATPPTPQPVGSSSSGGSFTGGSTGGSTGPGSFTGSSGSGGSTAAELVYNGDFSIALNGWGIGGGPVEADGGQARLSGESLIVQAIPTTPGATYTLAFDVTDFPGSFHLYDGFAVGSVTGDITGTGHYTATFTAAGSSTHLQFSCVGDGYALDNVSVR